MNKFKVLYIFLLFSVIAVSACQSRPDVKIIEEQDSLKKTLEERDSLRILKPDSITKY